MNAAWRLLAASCLAILASALFAFFLSEDAAPVAAWCAGLGLGLVVGSLTVMFVTDGRFLARRGRSGADR